MFTLPELEAAEDLVHRTAPASPQLRWSLLDEATGAKALVKNDNHLPTGAFRVHGGVTFIV